MFWKTIEAGTPYDGLYDASSTGLVRRRSTCISMPSRGQHQHFPEKLIRGRRVKDGYLQLSLAIGGKRRHPYIHHMILWAFKGLAPPGTQAAHLDGDNTNNDYRNLAWVTPIENIRQKYDHDTMGHKLRLADVIRIRAYPPGTTTRRIADLEGISQTTAGQIRRGATWRL